MCTSSDDSPEPAHKRTLCRNDVIQLFYDWRYLLIVRFRHLSHMLSHYVQLHARLCGSMRALLHAYLVGSIFCLSLRLNALPLCALGHNNGSDVCASSERPDETVHLPRLF